MIKRPTSVSFKCNVEVITYNLMTTDTPIIPFIVILILSFSVVIEQNLQDPQGVSRERVMMEP